MTSLSCVTTVKPCMGYHLCCVVSLMHCSAWAFVLQNLSSLLATLHLLAQLQLQCKVPYKATQGYIQHLCHLYMLMIMQHVLKLSLKYSCSHLQAWCVGCHQDPTSLQLVATAFCCLVSGLHQGRGCNPISTVAQDLNAVLSDYLFRPASSACCQLWKNKVRADQTCPDLSWQLKLLTMHCRLCPGASLTLCRNIRCHAIMVSTNWKALAHANCIMLNLHYLVQYGNETFSDQPNEQVEEHKT